MTVSNVALISSKGVPAIDQCRSVTHVVVGDCNT